MRRALFFTEQREIASVRVSAVSQTYSNETYLLLYVYIRQRVSFGELESVFFRDVLLTAHLIGGGIFPILPLAGRDRGEKRDPQRK